MLIYSAGLRRSELINLTLENIDSERMVILIHEVKGNKDRLTLLSEKLVIILRQYYMEYRPKNIYLKHKREDHIRQLVFPIF